jgi:hypothetical protein
MNADTHKHKCLRKVQGLCHTSLLPPATLLKAAACLPPWCVPLEPDCGGCLESSESSSICIGASQLCCDLLGLSFCTSLPSLSSTLLLGSVSSDSTSARAWSRASRSSSGYTSADDEISYQHKNGLGLPGPQQGTHLQIQKLVIHVLWCPITSASSGWIDAAHHLLLLHHHLCTISVSIQIKGFHYVFK